MLFAVTARYEHVNPFERLRAALVPVFSSWPKLNRKQISTNTAATAATVWKQWMKPQDVACYPSAVVFAHFSLTCICTGHELFANEEFDKAMVCYRAAYKLDPRHYNAL